MLSARKILAKTIAMAVVSFGICLSAGAVDSGLRGTFNAQVTAVDDGDTIAVLVAGQRHKIRLSDIDAPEVTHCSRKPQEECLHKGQPHGEESGRNLAALVMGRQVRLACNDYDARYSRSVCRVYAGNVDANYMQVKAGLAWFNKKYSRDALVQRAELEARSSRTGIWADRNPIEPWTWRTLCWKRGVCR